MKSLDNVEAINALSKLIAQKDKFVITCHISPDGDALGTSLALYNLLLKLGKDVRVVVPDLFPDNFRKLPGAKDIIIFTRYEEFATEVIQAADVVFCLDYNAISRIDRVGPSVLESKAKKVMIDHHEMPETFPDILISHPEISSTCALLFKVIAELQLLPLVDATVGSCIYTGMMTDTGNFSYNSMDPDLYEIIAKLVAVGVNKDKLYAEIINTWSLSKLQIMSYALDNKLKLYTEKGAALITLTRQELNNFHYKKGDTESLVNMPLKLKEIDFCFYLREETDYIKVSSRSKGDRPVNILCNKFFNGGGHKNAAGGEFYGTMDECIAVFEKMLEGDDIFNFDND